jgi:hypothetical protein
MVGFEPFSFCAAFQLEALGVGYFFRISETLNRLLGFALAPVHTPTPQSSISFG